jgi:hypothetical protein
MLMKRMLVITHKVIDRLDRRRDLRLVMAIRTGDHEGLAVFICVFREHTANTRRKSEFIHGVQRNRHFFLAILIDGAGFGIDQNEAVALALGLFKVEIILPKGDYVLLGKLGAKGPCPFVKTFVF